jgi:CubicO group peptidase (beta-lactamase class C family)
VCAHVLASRGELEIDAPVTTYWPEFGKNGKEAIPVRQLLNHQAGMAALREPIPDEGLCDWELVVDALATQEPLWDPGTRNGYSALTFGHLVGEVVRRVTGRRLGAFFREEIAEPLGLDFWIGLPEEHEHRVAPNISAEFDPTQPIPTFYQAALTDPTSIASMVVMNSGGFLLPDAVNNRRVHAAEIPSANGITNARGLAGLYRPLALDGAVDGVRLVDEGQLLAMSSVSSATSVDATMLVPTRWSLGFMKGVDNRHRPPGDSDSVLLSDDAFGHVGAGGSIGFADRPARVSFGYTMNRQGSTTGLDDRGQSLINAGYRALGYKQPSGEGLWYR